MFDSIQIVKGVYRQTVADGVFVGDDANTQALFLTFEQVDDLKHKADFERELQARFEAERQDA